MLKQKLDVVLTLLNPTRTNESIVANAKQNTQRRVITSHRTNSLHRFRSHEHPVSSGNASVHRLNHRYATPLSTLIPQWYNYWSVSHTYKHQSANHSSIHKPNHQKCYIHQQHYTTLNRYNITRLSSTLIWNESCAPWNAEYNSITIMNNHADESKSSIRTIPRQLCANPCTPTTRNETTNKSSSAYHSYPSLTRNSVLSPNPNSFTPMALNCKFNR